MSAGVRLLTAPPTLGALDNRLEVLAAVAQLAHAHARPVVVEQPGGGLLEHVGRQGRRARCKVVGCFSGHGGVEDERSGTRNMTTRPFELF